MIVLGRDMGYSSWLGKGIQHPTYTSASFCWYCDAPDSSTEKKWRVDPTTADHGEKRIFLTKSIVEASFQLISSKQTGIEIVSK